MVTPSETVRLLRFVGSVAPAQRMDETTPEAWLLVLEDVAYEDAKTAAVRVARRSPWIDAASVYTEARAVARERRAAQVLEPDVVPDADPDDPAAYLRALRAGRARPTQAELPARSQRVAAIVGRVARALPVVPGEDDPAPAPAARPVLREPEAAFAAELHRARGRAQAPAAAPVPV